MKKVALSLLAFALVGSMAFGQDAPAVKFSGYVNTGLVATSTNGGDWSVFERSDDYGVNGSAGKLTGSVTGANYGATAAIKADTAAGKAVLDTAKGWFSPVTGLTVFAGMGYNDAFDGVDDKSNDYFWAANGYAVSFGASGFVAGAQAGAAGLLGFGVAYSQDKLFTIRASGNTTDKQKVTKYAVSGSVSAVENLSLSAGYFAEGVDTSAVNVADAAVSYAFTPAFSAGVTAYDYVTAEYFTVQPNASYKLTDAVTVSGSYTLQTKGKATAAENTVKGKVAYTVGAGTLASWVTYATEAKTTTLEVDYLVSF